MVGIMLYLPKVMAKSMTYPEATPCAWSCAANITSKAIGTGMNTETRLTRAAREGVTWASRVGQGRRVRIAADRKLATSMSVMVGFTSIQTCLPYSADKFLRTDQKVSVQSSAGTARSQDAASSRSVKGLICSRRSSLTPLEPSDQARDE